MTYNSELTYEPQSPRSVHPEPYGPSTSYIPANSYINLPAPGSKHAPNQFKGRKYELEPFLEYYEQACERYSVTTSRDKYKGLIQYCAPKVIKTLKSLPSHKDKAYTRLVEELKYFYGDDEAIYNVNKVEAFATKWRQRKISDLEQFKKYHRKYLEIVGEAREADRITSWDYNRFFWEGLHESLRRKVENRMLTTNPDLDVTTPFKISKVVKAAEHILSPHRFDQHLLTRSGYNSSDVDETDVPPKPKPSSKPKYREVSEDDSDDSDDDIYPLFKSRPPTPPKPSPKGKVVKLKEDDEVDSLVEELAKMDINKPEFRALSIKILRKDPSLKGELDKMYETIKAAQPKPNYPRNPPRPPRSYPQPQPTFPY